MFADAIGNSMMVWKFGRLNGNVQMIGIIGPRLVRSIGKPVDDTNNWGLVAVRVLRRTDSTRPAQQTMKWLIT
jgi:hypothetical protein